MFHRAARLALGNPDRSRRWIPPGPGGVEAARRPHGRVTVLVAVLIAVLVAVLVTAPGDGPRPGGGPRRGREPEGDATASWPSNGISSGTRDREGRGAGEPEAPGQWHRDPNPRPSLSVSGEFSGKLGILSAASPRSSPQSRGIYGRLARAQPGVSRDPTPPNAPPMRAEARSRRPVSPIPGPPGKERAGEADMRGEVREAEAFCGRVESRRQSGTRPRRLRPGQASGSPMDGPGGPPGTMEEKAGPRPIGAGSARCWSDDSLCLCLRLGKDDPPGSPLPQSGASAAVPTGERSSGRPAAGFRPGVQRSGAFRSFGGLGDPAWDPAEWGPSADDPGRRGATGGVIHPAGSKGAPA